MIITLIVGIGGVVINLVIQFGFNIVFLADIPAKFFIQPEADAVLAILKSDFVIRVLGEL